MYRALRTYLPFILVAALAFAVAACNRGQTADSGKDSGATAIAATVNDKTINLSEVDRIISQQAKGQQAQMSPLELAAARLEVLNGLIQQEVLLQRAEKENLLPKEEEITNEINTRKQGSRMTEEDFQKTLRDANQTEQTLREEVRKGIAIQRLQEKVAGKISINDKEVEDFYNNNKQQFVNTRGVALAAIVVDPKDNGAQDDAKSEADAKSKIDVLYQRLKSGADFATIARASSEDPSNVRGGDVGSADEEQLKQSGFPSELIDKLFGPMQVGDITEPVRSSNGRWYIFKLTGKQLQNENLTLESPGVRDQIKDALINQRRTLLNAALVATAMSESKITNNLAQNMLNSPSNLSGLRPAGGGGAPATTASPAASPAAPPASGAGSPPPPAPAGSPTTAPSPKAGQ